MQTPLAKPDIRISQILAVWLTGGWSSGKRSEICIQSRVLIQQRGIPLTPNLFPRWGEGS
jgi:hypothetical protein